MNKLRSQRNNVCLSVCERAREGERECVRARKHSTLERVSEAAHQSLSDQKKRPQLPVETRMCVSV